MERLSPLDDLLDLQAGVISRRQALRLPAESSASIRRRLRRREWVTLHPGVYVNHTGEPTWTQRAWAATLALAPAALSHSSALRAMDGPGRRGHDDDGPIHVTIAHERTAVEPTGVVVHRSRHFDTTAQLNLSPPRLRIEHAVLQCAAAAHDVREVTAVLSDAVRSRRTTPQRLLDALAGHSRIAQRELLAGILTDAATGVQSVLELEYLRRVERAHRLPQPRRQAAARSTAGVRYRDLLYDEFGLVIELDGRLGHSTTAEREADFARDLDASLGLLVTVRLSWAQTVDDACATAARIGELLRRRGWRGVLKRCPSCAQAERVGSVPDAGHEPTR